ncbi:MAG TPA: acyl-CoA dehydrogenase family protein [Bauldia sp.]|nr:acyl-CoA dehydrogenase family protein [Bauldia sp.]
MADLSFLRWPFFEARHAAWRERVAAFAETRVAGLVDHQDADASCRRLVVALGEADLLAPTVVSEAVPRLDVRTLCLARETLAYHDGLADFAFALQGLGSGPVSLFGDRDHKRRLGDVAAGKAIPAFALTEPEAGSDVAAIATTAAPDGDHIRIDGEKSYISNGGIADWYVVFARTGEGPGARGLTAFLVDADTPGLSIAARIETMAPHPLARIVFDDCRVPATNRIGGAGEGFKVAMATLDVFRSTVGAAAVGLARRAFDETLAHVTARKMLGGTLADLQMTQSALAEMATDIDAAALLVYRAAWTKDAGAERVTREAAMAKWAATEAAQRVIDRAVQLHGALGVTVGVKVEQLYREIRALRIYEGATEIQKLIVARAVLAEAGR